MEVQLITCSSQTSWLAPHSGCDPLLAEACEPGLGATAPSGNFSVKALTGEGVHDWALRQSRIPVRCHHQGYW